MLIVVSCGQETYPPIVETPTYNYRHGQFVWHELATQDLEASQTFYGTLFGWEFEETDLGDAQYALIRFNDESIGGMIQSPSTAQSLWLGAISVEDTEKALGFLSSNGAESLIGSTRLTGRGTMALIKDPQEALVALVHSSAGDPQLDEPVTFSWLWMELWSENPEASANFYGSTLGYAIEEEEIDNKPYWVFSKGEVPVGGISQNPVRNMKSQWIPYIKVSDAGRTAERVKELGGEVFLEPTPDVRNGSVAVVADPNGAIFCLQEWPVNQ